MYGACDILHRGKRGVLHRRPAPLVVQWREERVTGGWKHALQGIPPYRRQHEVHLEDVVQLQGPRITPTRRELFLERKLAEERGRLNAARDELEAARDELETTRCEREATRGELDLLKARLDAAQRQIDRLSSTQMTAEEPAVENLSSVPEDTVSVPVQVTSQELVAGDRINLGVPNEDYTAIGRQLRLKDLATGEEFLCRHFAHPVIRYTEESWAPVEMTNTGGEA